MNLNEIPQLTLSEAQSVLGGEHIDADFIVAQPGEQRIKFNPFLEPTRFEGGAFAICLGGEAEVTVNLSKYTLKRGTMMILPANSIIHFHNHTPEFRSYMAGFSPTLFQGAPLVSVIPLMAEILKNPLFELSDGDAALLMKSCKYIHEKSGELDNPYRRDIMQHLLYAMFFELSHIFQKQREKIVIRPRTHNEEIMEDFGRLLSKNYKKERNVDFYADQLCLTPKYLSTLIKKTSERSVPEWIRFAVMMDAKMQLKYSTQTVQQISEDLNFPNPSFFGRFFKKHTSMTPLEYRMSTT